MPHIARLIDKLVLQATCRSRAEVRSFVVILTRNNGIEPKKVCKENPKAISEEYAWLETPIVTVIPSATACQLFLSCKATAASNQGTSQGCIRRSQ